MNAATKYWVLLGLSVVIGVATYLLNQPVITESTVIAAILVGATIAFHDLEPGSTN